MTALRDGGEVREKRLQAWHRDAAIPSWLPISSLLSTVATPRCAGSVNNRTGAGASWWQRSAALGGYLLSQTLREAEGNRTEPGKRLGIHRPSSKMQKCDIDPAGAVWRADA